MDNMDEINKRLSPLRRETKVVMVGNVAIGGKNPVSIQSMTNYRIPMDTEG